jgi:Flp pilus assembly protein TadG
MMWADSNFRRQGSPRHARRRGSLTVEMIIVVVVLLIVTVGIVQFGVFFANAQEVAFAARVGALEASQTVGLPASGDVPDNVIQAIQNHLNNSKIRWCHIRLEHNVTVSDTAVELESDSQINAVCQPKQNLPAPPATGTHYVRLTVCVPLRDVFPKQLSFFGEQLYPLTKTYEHTAVYRYELTTP